MEMDNQERTAYQDIIKEMKAKLRLSEAKSQEYEIKNKELMDVIKNGPPTPGFAYKVIEDWIKKCYESGLHERKGFNNKPWFNESFNGSDVFIYDGKKFKGYTYPMCRNMIDSLLRIYDATILTKQTWFHCADRKKPEDFGTIDGGEYYKLAGWGLVESMQEPEQITFADGTIGIKKCKGYWKITELGKNFRLGLEKIPEFRNS